MPDECSGHCQVQTYEIRVVTVAKSHEDCPDLSQDELKQALQLTDKTLIECRGGKSCRCVPRNVPSDDPSWSVAVKYRLREPRKFAGPAREHEGGAIGPCEYTITGTIEVRSRIDNDAICMPGDI
jgi:hypothetical protein